MARPLDLLLRNVRIVTGADDDCAVSPPSFVAVAQGRVARMGTMQTLDAGAAARDEVDGDGALLTPGLIDCHTHLVHAGDRAREFEQRLQGAS
ncbi:MAG TPA: imidazolonepropionase, partial [Albitalea sp.]